MKKTRLFIIYLIYSAFPVYSLQSQNLNLVVHGSSNNETKTIDSLGYKKLFQNFILLESEVTLLKSKLEEIGYIDIKQIEIKKANDSTYNTKLRLGNKYNTIYIYYDEAIISKDVLELLTETIFESYFTVNIKNVRSILSNINLQLTDKGYPFSSVMLSALKKRADNRSLEANLIVNLNTERTIDKIIVKGYENFPKSYLKHYLKLNSKKILNINSLRKKTNALSSLSFANLTREPEVLFTQDSSSVYLYIEKRKSNTFDGFLGFGTNKTNSKLEFDGYLNLSLNNNLNYGESFNLIYKSDENEQKTFNANVNAPYIFNTPIGVELDLNIFKKDSTFTTINQSGSLFYQINNQQTIYAGIESVKSNNLTQANTSLNIDDYNSTFYNVRYQLLKPFYNNLMFTSSFNLDIKLGFGNRNHKEINVKQTQYQVNTYKLFKLNSKNYIFFRINLRGIDSDNYFTNELLRFGGINSIRGFEENSLLATLYSFANFEYRYHLSQSIYVHTITDGAYLRNNQENTTNSLYGFGFGIGLLTKAGLLKLNYANGKTKGQKASFSNSKIHISLSAKF
ncbi:BamA/TamA family outer membrane protein [Pontimicrobium aquaticum]|uniref:Uncharacterized protein n=1 Tax=Pontimicrobium aquaticum TaxID=2565367 RepID=A0A4U0EYL0_9FLAO|nr:hypothetical protein [Pontimicrobium aquaticum]TJY37171.1 hypothetical protein E5167_04280 [Pontimicrobium aquaticum]